jgi:hypothetical protein
LCIKEFERAPHDSLRPSDAPSGEDRAADHRRQPGRRDRRRLGFRPGKHDPAIVVAFEELSPLGIEGLLYPAPSDYRVPVDVVVEVRGDAGPGNERRSEERFLEPLEPPMIDELLPAAGEDVLPDEAPILGRNVVADDLNFSSGSPIPRPFSWARRMKSSDIGSKPWVFALIASIAT